MKIKSTIQISLAVLTIVGAVSLLFFKMPFYSIDVNLDDGRRIDNIYLIKAGEGIAIYNLTEFFNSEIDSSCGYFLDKNSLTLPKQCIKKLEQSQLNTKLVWQLDITKDFTLTTNSSQYILKLDSSEDNKLEVKDLNMLRQMKTYLYIHITN